MEAAFTKIKLLLQKFSPEELMTLIPELFTGITWDAVYSAIRRNRLSCQSKFIAMTTLELYQESNPDKETTGNIIWALQFYVKIYHNSEDWHGVRLINQEDEVTDTAVIERNIIRAYRSEARDALVMLKLDDLIYVMTIEKKTSSRGVTYKKPFFFVYNHNLEEPFGFYSPKFKGCDDAVTYCCKGMGFESYEDIPLYGNDVTSLFGMVERDMNNSIKSVKKFKPETIKEEEGVMDFTLGKQREKYAEEILPGNTKLRKYSVQARNKWRGRPYLSELEGIQVESAITFQSSATDTGVEDLIKEIIKRGLLSLPVPAYIANIPNVSMNEIELEEQESQANITNGSIP